MEGRKQVNFKFEEKEISAFLVIPLPLSQVNVSDNIAAFSSTTRDLRRFRLVLKFINNFSRSSKTKEILRIIEDFLKHPEKAKETLIFTENYFFVRTTFRHEVLPRRETDRWRPRHKELQEQKHREISLLVPEELDDGVV